MALPRIEERTFYEPIVKYLNESGFQAIGNTKILDKEPDVLFRYGSQKFVIEVKIGKPDRIGVKAVAQAFDYGRKLETQNIIIVIYPEEMRNETISDYSKIQRIALETKARVISLTEVWTQILDITLKSFFTQLKENIEQSKTKFDFATTVKLIESYASDLNSVVYQIKTDELVSEVVNKLDLFTSVGEIKDKETAKRQVVNLASFLFFNQLLFYHIYMRKARKSNLPELEEIKEIDDIKFYFSKITEVDYQAIYKVDLISHLPNKKDVIGVINDIIKAIKLLRAEQITHDLAGRFFHDLIPFEVRKILAAFYTHPNAADLLTNLTIDRWDETVIDPACGSGTLLVASYNRKRELYEKLYGFTKTNEMHKKFIENDLTGIDLMPFAAHLSAINLTMQNIEEQTNTLRIATMDSLELAESLKYSSFRRDGIKLSPYTTQIQRTLDKGEFAKVKRIKGSVSAEGRGSEFYLKPVDVVIMNPPFSDREKMPKEMREKINKNELSRICGNQVNLWGYFLALSDKLLKPEGKIAVVIPINIARGQATDKIREYIFRNYRIDYIIKPQADLAFSEGASFRDILLVASKNKPKENDQAKIAFLNVSIRSLDTQKINEIANKIKQGFSSNDVTVKTVYIKEFLGNLKNLMPFLSQKSNEILEILKPILDSPKLSFIKNKTFSEGFHVSPKGFSEILFITNPFSKNRVKKAFLILERVEDDKISFKIKDTKLEYTIPISKVYKAFRTITDQQSLLLKETDYFIKSPFDGFDSVIKLSKWKYGSNLNWESINKEAMEKRSEIIIPERFNPYSMNTHILSIYSDDLLVIPHTLRFGKGFSKEDARLQVLFLNSTIFLSQLIMKKEETTGEYIHIMDTDLIQMKYLNLDKLTRSDKDKLLKLFDEISKINFPSITQQLNSNFEPRRKMDSTILEVLGFDQTKVTVTLSKLYTLVSEELNYMKI